jgi:DNA polymerase-4
LAKIASDWRKPNGLFVIQPAEVENFLSSLPVGRIPGVGKVTEEKLAKLGMRTTGELRTRPLEELHRLFGRFGKRLFELARGVDENPVVPNRPTKSISAEDTFEQDVLLAETEPTIRRLAEKAWLVSRKESRIAHTVVLKLKTAEFHVFTRSQTPPSPPASSEELTRIALALLSKVAADPRQRFRLVGVGLGNFRASEERAEPSLFPR